MTEPERTNGSIPIQALPEREHRLEWEHFRDFGWSDQRIADRLNLNWDTIQHWVRKYRDTHAADNPVPNLQQRAG